MGGIQRVQQSRESQGGVHGEKLLPEVLRGFRVLLGGMFVSCARAWTGGGERVGAPASAGEKSLKSSRFSIFVWP